MEIQLVDLLSWILKIVVVPVVIWLVRLYSTVNVIQNDVKWIKESFSVTGKKSVRVLHSPHTPDLDALLDKYEHEEITYEEVIKLVSMLEEIEQNPRSRLDKREAATRLLGSIIVRYRILEK